MGKLLFEMMKTTQMREHRQNNLFFYNLIRIGHFNVKGVHKYLWIIFKYRKSRRKKYANDKGIDAFAKLSFYYFIMTTATATTTIMIIINNNEKNDNSNNNYTSSRKYSMQEMTLFSSLLKRMATMRTIINLQVKQDKQMSKGTTIVISL